MTVKNQPPKMIWIGNIKPVVYAEHIKGTQDTPYIRADIVHELAKSLFIARNAFRSYQAHHEHKGDMDKAERNKGYAEQMEASLKLLDQDLITLDCKGEKE